MKVRDTDTGEEYEVADAPTDTPNPDIPEDQAPEFLIECINPAGEAVTMSVVEGTKVIAVEGGVQVLPPIDAPNQFEEVTDNG